MRLRAAFLALAFCFVAFPIRADTLGWSFTYTCESCGPYVNQQGMPVDTGGTQADLFVEAGGRLTTTDTPVNGALTITGITGTRTTNWYIGYQYPAETNSITGLIPPDPTNPFGLTIAPDNLLYLHGNPIIDISGFAFTLDCSDCGDYGLQPPGIVQIAGQGPNAYSELGTTGYYSGDSSFGVGLVPATTPEPSTFVLFGMTGCATVFYRLRRALRFD